MPARQGFGAGGRGSSARGGAGNGGGGRAGGGGRMVGNSRPFQPPGLMKAIGDQQGGGGGGIAGGGGGAPENERYPPRLMEMLEKKGLIGKAQHIQYKWPGPCSCCCSCFQSAPFPANGFPLPLLFFRPCNVTG